MPHRLLSFESIRFFEGRNVEPVGMFLLQLLDLFRRIADRAVDLTNIRAVDATLLDVCGGSVFRKDYGTAHPGARSVCRASSSGIAGGRETHVPNAKFMCSRDGECKSSRLERPGRHHRFIFDPNRSGTEFSFERCQTKYRRHTLAQGDDGRRRPQRQHRQVLPERIAARSDLLAPETRTCRRDVIRSQERFAASFADSKQFRTAVLSATNAAL